MAAVSDIRQLAHWLAGHFNNKLQAMRDPVWFANIHVYQCPLPWAVLGGWGMYVEQAYDIMLDRPYRQRVLHLQPGDPITIQNYDLRDPERWRGSGQDLARLHEMTAADCDVLPGCVTTVQWNGSEFVGQSLPGKTCRVIRKGVETYLHSEFRIKDGEFYSLDQGRDLHSDQVIWGSLSGSFEFRKIADFSTTWGDAA
ncbi:MAG: chromophore lyase CpcT/CpeT [Synechococcales cyanobacterium]